MTRIELYHVKPKHNMRKGLIFFILACFFLTTGFFILRYYYISSIRIDTPLNNLGRKVVIHLPNGQEVLTYEKRIFEKDGKTYYKSDDISIDLTGGKIEYKNWK